MLWEQGAAHCAFAAAAYFSFVEQVPISFAGQACSAFVAEQSVASEYIAVGALLLALAAVAQFSFAVEQSVAAAASLSALTAEHFVSVAELSAPAAVAASL